MKVLPILLLFISTIFSSVAQEQRQHSTEQRQLIESFLHDIQDGAAADVVLNQYVWLPETLSDENFDYLMASIDEIRLNLQTKNIEDINIIPYAQVSRQETRDIVLEGKDSASVYFLKHKNRQMLALYLEADKIASFTLVSKGDRVAHFVTY